MTKRAKKADPVDAPILHNPEVSMPVHVDNDWHVPELIGRMWTAGEIQDALTGLGFTPLDVDHTMHEPCDHETVEERDGCVLCGGTGTRPLQLVRSKRWAKGGQALRVPNERDQIVNPYLAACVVAAMR